MIWQHWATSDIMNGFTIRIQDPDHIGGPITTYAIGEKDLLAAARDYANTTTDRVKRRCIATLLLWQKGRTSITECQHIYFDAPLSQEKAYSTKQCDM